MVFEIVLLVERVVPTEMPFNFKVPIIWFVASIWFDEKLNCPVVVHEYPEDKYCSLVQLFREYETEAWLMTKEFAILLVPAVISLA